MPPNMKKTKDHDVEIPQPKINPKKLRKEP